MSRFGRGQTSTTSLLEGPMGDSDDRFATVLIEGGGDVTMSYSTTRTTTLVIAGGGDVALAYSHPAPPAVPGATGYTLTLGGVDYRAAVPFETIRIEEKAGGVATCSLWVLDPGRTMASPLDAELVIAQSGVRLFAGFIRDAEAKMAGRTRYYECSARDYNSLLDEDAVPSPASRTTSESDKARVEWLIATHGTKGITGGTTVQTVLASMPGGIDGVPEQDFAGKTMREALNYIARLSGAVYYVDFNFRLHWYPAASGEGLTSPFNLSDTPNYTSTFPHYDLAYPRSSIDFRNAVFVLGHNIAGWRPNPPPSSATRRAAVLRDDAIETQAALDAAGDAYLAQHGLESSMSGDVLQPGLRAGMAVQMTAAVYGLSASAFMVASINTRMLNTSTPVYRVTLGVDLPTLAGIVGGAQAQADLALSAAQAAAAAVTVQPIADLTTGGANMIANSSFELSRESGWLVGANWAFGVPVVDAYDHNNVAEAAPVATTVGNLDTPRIGIVRSDDWWASIWSLLRTPVTSGSAVIEALEYDSIQTLLKTTTLATISGPQSSWTRYALRFGPNTAYGRVAFQPTTAFIGLRMRGSGTCTFVWDVDAAQIERGALLSGYAPAPYELLDSQIVGPEIADAAIAETQIADDAISTPKLRAGAVDTNKLAANAIVAGKIAAGAISAYHIDAAGLAADVIRSGTLTLGGVAGAVLTVLNATGDQIGLWNETGLYLVDPTNPLLQLKLVDGTLSFSTDGGAQWTTALSGDGITADAITLGTAPGGHNAIPNASFELTAFRTQITKLWDVTADWAATIGTDVNVTKTGASLTLTTSTY